MPARGLCRRISPLFWLPLPDAARIQVPVSQLGWARAEVARARALLASARCCEHGGAGQLALALDALHVWLAAIGRLDEAAPLDLMAAVRAGAARVAASATAAPSITRALAHHVVDSSAPGATESKIPEDSGGFREILALCEWTDVLLDVASPRERALRNRLAGVLVWPRGAVVAAAAALLVTAALLRAPRNLALGKAVTASSICGATPAPPFGHDPIGRLARLVDGVTVEGAVSRVEWAHGSFAACTELEVHPWITIDLGAEHTIDGVVVYNRSDCCWGADDTPVEVQLSDDNRSFATVASTELPFTDDFPWRPSFRSHRARYVRIYNPADLPRNLVLSEIEVHGR